MTSRGFSIVPSARTRKGFVFFWAALFVMSLVLQYASVAAPQNVLAGANVVDFRQASNNFGQNPVPGDVKWINSIIQKANSVYFEGMSVPQRTVFTGIESTNDNTHTLTFDHQATKNGNHAYDWLTSYDQAIEAADDAGFPYVDLIADACGANIGPPNDLGTTCQSLRDGAYSIEVDVPNDPFISKDGVTQDKIDAYEVAYGDRTIWLYGNEPITDALLTIEHSVADLEDDGDSDAQYVLTWTSASTELLIEMAGHLAITGAGNGISWGLVLGAAQINGGPYHFNLDELDDDSLGSQDNPIKGADIFDPDKLASTTATLIHDADHQVVTSVSVGTIVHDQATVTGSGSDPTPTGTVTFSWFTNGTCENDPAATSSAFTLSGGSVDGTTFTQTPTPAGSYAFQATYSGDDVYNGSTGPCEPLSVGKLASTTATLIHIANHGVVTSVSVGTVVHDQATVTGSGPTPTGSVTFSWFTNGTCASTPAATSSAFTLSGGSVDGTTFTQTPTPAGSYAFQATYSGNGVYNGSTGPCEPLSVTSGGSPPDDPTDDPTGSLTITKVLNPATAFPGGTFTFNVSCNQPQTITLQPQTITLAAGQATGSVTINGLTIGSTCTVTEVTPLTSAGEGWQWAGQPLYGPGQAVSVPNTVTVTVTNFRGEVAGVIATPRVTLPPTDSLDSGTSSSPGVNLGLILLLFSGIMTVLGFLTPVPARARRRDRRD